MTPPSSSKINAAACDIVVSFKDPVGQKTVDNMVGNPAPKLAQILDTFFNAPHHGMSASTKPRTPFFRCIASRLLFVVPCLKDLCMGLGV
jgi:hypothetical protein